MLLYCAAVARKLEMFLEGYVYYRSKDLPSSKDSPYIFIWCSQEHVPNAQQHGS